MDPTSTPLPAHRLSGSVPEFNLGPKTRTALILQASLVSLRAGTVLPLSSAPPPPPPFKNVTQSAGGALPSLNWEVLPRSAPSLLLSQARTGDRGARGKFPLRKVGEGAAGQPSFLPSLAPAAGGPQPGPRASACARLCALSPLRERLAHRQSDGPTDWLPVGQTGQRREWERGGTATWPATRNS